MAEGAVSFLLDKLTFFLEEKVKLVKGLKEEGEFVRDELERMKAFLRVADAAEESDPELKLWVKQVRDVAYDTEALLDRCMLHLMQNGGNGNRFNVLVKLIRSVKNLRISHEIGTEIRSIKSRMSSVAEGHRRYQNKFNFPNQGLMNSVIVNDAVNDRRGDALLLEEAELIGIESRRKELSGLVMDGYSGLRVVSVVGMGGLGKTTLVKQLYDEADFKKNFQNHAWITVSESFKLEDLLKDLIQQLFDEIKQTVPQELTTMNAYQLKVSFKQFLSEKRYLLAFDDIWSIQAWDDIKCALPNDNCGSRVILTTRHIDVASYSTMQNHGYVYELKPLSPGESWSLFCQKTFKGSSSSCPPHLKEISLSILKRCGGLPLAIVAIAGVLATKSVTRIDDWVVLNQSLGAEFEGNDKLQSMKLILSLSFNDLPYYLKSCYLYLSIYPEDFVFERNTVLRIWVAEGFVKQMEGRTVEEVAEGYLNELVNRNLIRIALYNDDGSFKSGRLHDFLREMLLPKSRDHYFMISKQNSMSSNKVRHLSIHGKLANLQLKRSGSELLSLLTFGMEDTRSMSNLLAVLNNCRILKVLDLTGAPLETVPETVFEFLHLTYLSLRSTKVKFLPRSIEKLQKLETIDLKNTYITELPVEILNLQHLRHLLVYRHVEYSYLPFDRIAGFKALKGIGRLTSLQKLSFVDATDGSGIFSQLEMLKELRRLSMLKLRREDGMRLCKCIQKLQKIRSLSISSTGEYEVLDLDNMTSSPPFLQRLYLNGRLSEFPKWIVSLHCLIKIYLRWSRLEVDPLQYLQELPNLVHLEFLVGYVGSQLHFKAAKFQKLKLLNLDKVEPLRLVIVEKGAMPNLEKLMIQRCSFLHSVPIGIEWLRNIKFLEFFDMPDEFVAKIRQHGEDYKKIAHIPEVYYTYWKNGDWEANPLEGERMDENFSSPAIVIKKTYERRNSL